MNTNAVIEHRDKVKILLRRGMRVVSCSAGRIGTVIVMDDEGWARVENKNLRGLRRTGITRFGDEVRLVRIEPKTWAFEDLL